MPTPPRPSRAGGPLRLVAIGGGNGLSSLLSGLKHYVPLVNPDRKTQVEITAVVTVTDDGGSSGRLRRELEILPPGDIRNCMVALSEDEALLSRLFQYRFDAGRGLKGHSFGNLFLSALTHLTGDFAQAVRLSSEVLASRGHIFPSTASNVVLEAVMADGSVIAGETKISKYRGRIEQLRLRPGSAKPLKATLAALRAADLIVFGPGSLYTSVIPNLLVDGIAGAVRRSRAAKAYFVNLMWQPWETMQYSAADHLEAIHRHAGGPLIDTVVVNTHPIPQHLRRLYAAQRVYAVQFDLPRLTALGVSVVGRNLLAKGDKIRHDGDAAAKIAIELARRARQRRSR